MNNCQFITIIEVACSKVTSVCIFLFVCLLIGCGQNHRARQLVGDFLENNLKESDYEITDYSSVDSTYHLRDSILWALQKENNQSLIYKKINYQKRTTRKLFFMRVNFRYKDKPVCQTFYFDDHLERVVCFKDN